MDPRLFIVVKLMARLLLEFATRQGNSYVSVFSSDGDWKAKRFATFLSRKIPTRMFTWIGMDQQRLPQSQLFFYPPMSDCTSLQYGDVRSQDTWLIPSSCLPLPPSIKLGVDSNVFSYSLEANGSVIIHELYKVFPQDLITVRYSSTFDGWNLVPENENLRHTRSSASIESRSDLKGRNIKLCALPFPVMTMSDDGGRNFYGFSIDMINALATAMNFTHSYVLPEDGHWGSRDPGTGAWNGMIGNLIDGKCDICITGLFMTDSRREVIDYNPIIWDSQAVVIVDPAEMQNWMTFISPLEYQSWVVVGVAIVVCGVALTLSGHLLEGNEEFRLYNSMLFSSTAIAFMRRWNVIPYSQSGRLTFLAILVCGTFVHSYWRAALVSTLTVSWFKYPFETLQDLSESEYELSYQKGGAMAATLSQAPEDSIFGKLWKNNVPLNEDGTAKNEGYMSPFGIDFMSESSRAPTAWIMSKGLAIRLPAYRDCKVVMLPQTFLPLPASFAYPKNSSLAIIIDYQFGKLQETGVQTRIEKKYTPLAPECRDGPYFERKAVSLTKVCMAAYLFAYGFCISWALFIIETIHYNRMRAMRIQCGTLLSSTDIRSTRM